MNLLSLLILSLVAQTFVVSRIADSEQRLGIIPATGVWIVLAGLAYTLLRMGS